MPRTECAKRPRVSGPRARGQRCGGCCGGVWTAWPRLRRSRAAPQPPARLARGTEHGYTPLPPRFPLRISPGVSQGLPFGRARGWMRRSPSRRGCGTPELFERGTKFPLFPSQEERTQASPLPLFPGESHAAPRSSRSADDGSTRVPRWQPQRPCRPRRPALAFMPFQTPGRDTHPLSPYSSVRVAKTAGSPAHNTSPDSSHHVLLAPEPSAC